MSRACGIDCKICKNREHDCLMDSEDSCENFKLDCNLCRKRYNLCRVSKGNYCGDFVMSDGHYDGEDFVRDELHMDISKGVIK